LPQHVKLINSTLLLPHKISKTVVSCFLPFANVSWWQVASHADTILLDGEEHFEKMTFRNKYKISGANNCILLSIPIAEGRNQKAAMKTIRIANTELWQQQHWKTLVSAYRKSPYFDFYEPDLKPLYTQKFEYLIEYCEATLLWAAKQMKLQPTIAPTNSYVKNYPPDITDLRHLSKSDSTAVLHPYPQVFSDRFGFLPNLSILDLLFCTGPDTTSLLAAM
jgi:WbqC-like protein family